MDFPDSVHLNKIFTFFNVYSSAYDVDDPEASTNFICTLTVSDGQLSDTSSLHIILNNINDNSPTFDTPAYDFTTVADVSLNTVIGSVTATDGDVGELGKLRLRCSSFQTLFKSSAYTFTCISLCKPLST